MFACLLIPNFPYCLCCTSLGRTYQSIVIEARKVDLECGQVAQAMNSAGVGYQGPLPVGSHGGRKQLC